MDFLEENFGAETAPVSLNELVATELPPTVAPKGSIRNRAATTAMLTGNPEKAIENYQLLMAEGEEGKSAVYTQLKDSILENTDKVDMHGVMSVLGDPKIPFEQKRKIVEGIKGSQFLKDSGTILHTNSLSAGSKGENRYQEDARISSADAIREIYMARNQIQGLVNAHGATLDGANMETVGDMAALWVLPFGNSISVGKVKKGIAEAEGKPLSVWETVKGFLAPGTTTANIRKQLENLPPEKRVEYTRSVIEGIKANSGIIFGNDNQFAQWEKATSIFEDGGYGSFNEWIDNLTPILDVIGVGQVVRGFKQGAKGAKGAAKAEPSFNAAGEKVFPAEWELVDEIPKTGTDVSTRVRQAPDLLDIPDQIKRIEYNSVVRKENPASPASIVQQANPEQARNIHATVFKSSTDEVSEALYGVDKNQAIINDTMPQITTEYGRVTAKVPDIDRNLRIEMHVPDELIEMVNNTGAYYYTKGEKAQARANVVNDFGSAEGLSVNDAMSSFTIDGGRIKIDAAYGTPEGGFLRAEDAMEQAKYALRSKGVMDEEITILQKQGLDYVPVKYEDVVGKDGSYMVRISTFHDIDPTDISNFEALDVKRNSLDRVGPLVSQNTGSAARYVMDAASMLHPTYTGAASVVSDQTAKFDKFMLTLAAEYSDKYTKLPKARQPLVDDYIREANFKGIKYDQVDLMARGFNTEEINALKSWRDFWDSHFYLENFDIVKTLNSQGYEKFKNTNTELYVKPIPKNQNLGGLYDPATDSVIFHSKTEGDILYAAGGTYAKLRRPTDFNGVTAEHMIVRNTPTEYTRKFRDSDQVLNYRDGYFQIQYKAPKFVDEIEKDANGIIKGTRAVAVAGDTKEAEFFAKRMGASTGKEYKVRGDARALRRDDDAWWDINSAGGRIAQRHRGKLLEDASGLNHLGDGSYVMNPVDSAIRAAKSIAGRTVARPMLEAAKARFINQYGDMLPPNKMGGRSWPSNVKEISEKGNETGKKVSDARTTYEYINYLENGYINSADEIFKVGMNAIANMFGKSGMSTLERGAMALSEQAPTGKAKNFTFMAYIGSNVLRQWIIQPHQIVRTYAYNPIGWVNGGIQKLAASYVGDKMGLGSMNPAFTKFLDDSGLLDAVDKQNLVRGTLSEAADTTNKAVRIAKAPLTFTRKVGFDIGENANIIGHAAAVYERRTRLGQDLSQKAIRDEAYSEIRAISYDMNFAGDMPYNQTTPAAVLQFMQVPHKAFLQMTNRRIDPMIRARMAAADLIMWGGPTALVADLLGADILPDDPFWREAFNWGMESALMNQALSTLTGDDVNIDFSSLAPYDMTGWSKFFTAMYSGGVEQMIANSPSGQLIMKEGGRTRNAIASMARYFGAIEDVDEDGQTFLQVMNEVAKISSGYSNAYKAKLLLDARKRYDQYGNTIDQTVSAPEAWAQAFGFGTSSTRDLYRVSMEMSKDVKAHREEVLKVYEGIKRYYAETLEVENSDPVFITKVTGRMMKVFQDDPVALAIISKQLSSDLKGKDAALIDLFMKRSAIPSLGGLKDQVKQMPVSDEQKELMLKRIDDVENMRSELKEK
jgi:hypothetical protein